MASVYSELKEFCQHKIDSGVIVHVDWLQSEFLQTKREITGSDAPFYRICAQAQVASELRRLIGRYDLDREGAKARPEDQMIFPGFQELRKAYTVKRDGRQMIVPVHLMTSEERLMRADQIEEIGRGCLRHAQELRDYDAQARAA